MLTLEKAKNILEGNEYLPIEYPWADPNTDTEFMFVTSKLRSMTAYRYTHLEELKDVIVLPLMNSSMSGFNSRPVNNIDYSKFKTPEELYKYLKDTNALLSKVKYHPGIVYFYNESRFSSKFMASPMHGCCGVLVLNDVYLERSDISRLQLYFTSMLKSYSTVVFYTNEGSHYASILKDIGFTISKIDKNPKSANKIIRLELTRKSLFKSLNNEVAKPNNS